MEFDRLKFDYDPNIMAYNDIISKGLSYNQKGIIKFNEHGLRSIICTLSSMQINGLNYTEPDRLRNNFINISSKKYFLLENSKRFFSYQLDAMDRYSSYEFELLLNHKFQKESFLEDELLNTFVTEEVLDETYLLRNVEYGYYCLKTITKTLFSNIIQSHITSFSNKFKNKDIINSVIGILIKEEILNKQSLPLSLNKLIVSSFEEKFSNKKLSPEFYYDLGLTIKKNSDTIMNNLKPLRVVTEKIIDKGLSQRKSKGISR